VQEPVFGPVVVFGLGGINTGVLADHAARLAPLTDADAEDLIRAIRAGAAAARARHRGAARCPAARLPARRRPALGHRARSQPGDRPPGRRHRRGRPHPGDREHLADPFLRRLPQ